MCRQVVSPARFNDEVWLMVFEHASGHNHMNSCLPLNFSFSPPSVCIFRRWYLARRIRAFSQLGSGSRLANQTDRVQATVSDLPS